MRIELTKTELDVLSRALMHQVIQHNSAIMSMLTPDELDALLNKIDKAKEGLAQLT